MHTGGVGLVAELKIVEWLELVSFLSDNGDPLECWPCMGDTELVNGDSGSSDTSAAVRSSVKSERHTGEHSPSRSTTLGTVVHATGPPSGPRYPSKSSSHDSPYIYSKRTAGSEDILACDAIKDSRKHSESVRYKSSLNKTAALGGA